MGKEPFENRRASRRPDDSRAPRFRDCLRYAGIQRAFMRGSRVARALTRSRGNTLAIPLARGRSSSVHIRRPAMSSFAHVRRRKRGSARVIARGVRALVLARSIVRPICKSNRTCRCAACVFSARTTTAAVKPSLNRSSGSLVTIYLRR